MKRNVNHEGIVGQITALFVSDDWDAYAVKNEQVNTQGLPNECHSMDDDWDDYEAVNDPASGKKLPNEGHARLPVRLSHNAGCSSAPTSQGIFVTDTFVKNISEIYGSFKPNDDEYPAMGITIQGAPIFVECVRFPDCAVERHRATDKVEREHPAVGELWQKMLCRYEGKCRTSTVHIHPMNLPSLSSTDISNFDSLRLNPNDPSTFDSDHPYPVILVNLDSGGKLDMKGFWVIDGTAHRVELQSIRDDAPIIKKAWRSAEKMPYFTKEGDVARRINQLVSKEWQVELGVNPKTGAKAIKAQRSDGKKALICFNSDNHLGLSFGGGAVRRFCLEEYIDWTRIFNDIVGKECGHASAEANHKSEDFCHNIGGREEDQAHENAESSVTEVSSLTVEAMISQ
ncbi:hypothetical protein JXL19_11940 [bacterium]|nr:hypothetical protein [bacterium]